MAETQKAGIWIWRLVQCAAGLVGEAKVAQDEAGAEEMERVFRETILPLLGVPAVKEAEAHAEDAHAGESSESPSVLDYREERLLLAISRDPGVRARQLSKAAKVYGLDMRNIREALERKGLIEVATLSGRGTPPQTVCKLTSAGEERVRALLAEEQGSLVPDGARVNGTGDGTAPPPAEKVEAPVVAAVPQT